MKKFALFLIYLIITTGICFSQTDDSIVHSKKPTIISGKIIHPKSDTLTLIINETFIDLRFFYPEFHHKTILNSKGEFSFQIFIDEPVMVEVYADNTKSGYRMRTISLNLLLEPGDSIFFECEERFYRKTIQFSGDKAIDNDFLIKNNFKTQFGIISEELITSENYTSSQINHEFIRFGQTKFTQKYDELFHQLMDKKNELSHLGLRFLKNTLLYNFANSNFYFVLRNLNIKIQAFGSISIKHGDSSSISQKLLNNMNYFGFIDSVPLNQEKTPFSKGQDAYIDYCISLCHSLFRIPGDNDTLISPHEKYFMAKSLLKGSTEFNYLSRFISRCLRFEEMMTDQDIDEIKQDFFSSFDNYPNISYLKKHNDFVAHLKNRGKAPDFKLTDLSGNNFSLSEYKGKQIIMHIADRSEKENSPYIKLLKKIYDSAKDVNDLQIIILYANNGFSLFRQSLDLEGRDIKVIHAHGSKHTDLSPYLIYRWKNIFYCIDKQGNFVPELNASRQQTYKLLNHNQDSLVHLIHESFEKTEEKGGNISSRTIIYICFVIVTLLLLSFLVYRYRLEIIKRKEERKRTKTELELKSIRSQLNPHFMFNALNSIQYLINSKNVESANTYLSEFSDLMRFTLENSNQNTIPIAQEIELIKKYCEIEKLRYNFDYFITIDENLDIHTYEIPTMLMQPFIENSLIHGISEIKNKGEIRLDIKKMNDYIHICIEDNGIGLLRAKQNKSKNNGYGISSAKQRIELYNLSNAGKSSLQIIDKSILYETDNGTKVEINLYVED